MRKIALLFALALLPFPAFAQNADLSALRAYAARALPKCPGSQVILTPIEQQGPRGFFLFQVEQKSVDPNCGKTEFLMYSPSTHQIILGSVFRLPFDSRPLQERVGEFAQQVMKQKMRISPPGFPTQDGIKPISLTKDTAYGPFSYHAYVDASEGFLMVGTRGNLAVDPGKTLVDAIGLARATRRGNAKSKTTIIELSDFECPTCGRAHKTIEPIIAKNLKNVDYYRIDLPLYEHHEWAMFAALGARAIQQVAPAKYWEYVNFVFENQENIGKEFDKSKSFDAFLKNFVEDRDMNWKAIEAIYRSQKERTAILEQVSRAFDNGINSTPTYIIDGQVMGYGPEGTFTIENVKKAVGAK